MHLQLYFDYSSLRKSVCSLMRNWKLDLRRSCSQFPPLQCHQRWGPSRFQTCAVGGHPWSCTLQNIHTRSRTCTRTVAFSAQIYSTWNMCVTCGADLEHDGGFGFDSFRRAEIIVLGFHRVHQVIVHMVPKNARPQQWCNNHELILNITVENYFTFQGVMNARIWDRAGVNTYCSTHRLSSSIFFSRAVCSSLFSTMYSMKNASRMNATKILWRRGDRIRGRVPG